MLEKLAFQALIGLSFSMYLWLLAAGLTLVFGVLGVLNFAHGSLFMLGAYATFTFYGKLGLNFWLSIGLSLTSEGTMEPILASFSIFGGIAVAVALWVILEKTWWGRIIRASASDREMASAIGINIPILFTTVFVFAAMLAALGGALGTPVRVVAPGIGTAMIIQAFVITVIGGLGNLKGAFVGALIVGILTSFGILLFPVFELFIIFVVMTIVLMVTPEGLFGK